MENLSPTEILNAVVFICFALSLTYAMFVLRFQTKVITKVEKEHVATQEKYTAMQGKAVKLERKLDETTYDRDIINEELDKLSEIFEEYPVVRSGYLVNFYNRLVRDQVITISFPDFIEIYNEEFHNDEVVAEDEEIPALEAKS